MNQIENLKKIAKRKLRNNDTAHDFEHIMRVYRNAEKICKTENGNKKLILSAVLLHDIIKIKNRKDSAIKSAKLSKKILKEKNYSGWLVVEAEQDPSKANPFEYAKIGFNYLSKTAKDCGFEIIN